MTAAFEPPVPDPGGPAVAGQTGLALPLAEGAIPTAVALRQAIEAAVAAAPQPKTTKPGRRWKSADEAAQPRADRATALAPLKAALEHGRRAIAEALAAAPDAARAATAAYAALTDLVVTEALWFVQTAVHPAAGSNALALVAVGGYGRGELAPFSDVDLLFLTPNKRAAWSESVIESTLYLLWDLKLKVGQSVRTVEECLRLAKSDITIRTSLLENRHLTGDAHLTALLNRRLWDELFSKTGPDFVDAKLAERDARHRAQGGSRYLLEPNVKESKGGLRDLQTLYWIAKYLHRADSAADLVAAGVFSHDEVELFEQAESFLWSVRCQMHLIAGRPVEKLTFDMQVEVADIMGFGDSGGRRAVEHFMQTYFRHAMTVGALTRVFSAALEARHVKEPPRIARALLNAFTPEATLPEGYRLVNGRLDLTEPDRFFTDPCNLLRIFQDALALERDLHPDAMRRIAGSLDLITDDMRHDPEANRIFLDLLIGHRNPDRTLRQMNELGVLGQFLPEFGRIVAMMQFNIYHHYTVDEHTIQTISTLCDIEQGQLVEELPIASAILARGVNRRVLYTALLLHDIGKGLPEDHSIIGEGIARQACPRLGLDAEETDTVAWLVRHHLAMSDTAQKRDLSDSRTVGDFARLVESPARLKLLTVLTVCDIRGVGPGAWNNWKAMLLRQLYRETLALLTEGATVTSRPERIAQAQAALRATLTAAGWESAALAAEIERHYEPYWLGLGADQHTRLAELGRSASASTPATDIDEDHTRDATLACFMMPDHPGLFSRMAGAVAMAGANVVDARTYTTKDGMATTVFWLQDADGSPYENARLDRLRRTITRTLAGEVVAQEALRTRDKVKKRESEFQVPTDITIDNDGSDIYTIIEVDTRDRPGLLHDLTRTLADMNISIASAIIATFGAQAVDSFYVKDLFGLKIQSRAKQTQIKTRLLAAIQRGRARAEG